MKSMKRFAALTLAAAMGLSLLSLTAGAAGSKPGDVNRDGAVDRKDRIYLARYLAGWDGYSDIDKAAANVNGDGSVDRKDRIYLARYLAGWDGYALHAAPDEDSSVPEESKPDTGSVPAGYVQGVHGLLPDADGDGIPDGYSEPGWARSEENPANQTGNTTPVTPYTGRDDHDDSDKENSSGATAMPDPEPEHTHDWKPVYATREVTTYTTEQQITGYTDGDPIYGTEDVWVGTWNICNWCGERFSTGNGISDHFEETGHNGCTEEDRYETQTVVTGYEQVPVYSEVQVPHTSTEQYIDHYECSCGETKEA